MPDPPSRVSVTKPTRQRTTSMPVYSASPPLTPPSIVSVPLRRSWGRGRGPGDCSVDGGGKGVAEVMRQACSPRPRPTIGEAPDPSLVLAVGEIPAPQRGGTPTDDAVGAPVTCWSGPFSRAAPAGGRRRRAGHPRRD